jgi:hypothetical protein
LRKLFVSQFPGIPPELQGLFNELESASHDGDVVDIGQAFTINGSFTETTVLNVSAPTTANIAAVLATLILYLQRGGATRST